jgi:hypothetical protein
MWVMAFACTTDTCALWEPRKVSFAAGQVTAREERKLCDRQTCCDGTSCHGHVRWQASHGCR